VRYYGWVARREFDWTEAILHDSEGKRRRLSVVFHRSVPEQLQRRHYRSVVHDIVNEEAVKEPDREADTKAVRQPHAISDK